MKVNGKRVGRVVCEITVQQKGTGGDFCLNVFQRFRRNDGGRKIIPIVNHPLLRGGGWNPERLVS